MSLAPLGHIDPSPQSSTTLFLVMSPAFLIPTPSLRWSIFQSSLWRRGKIMSSFKTLSPRPCQHFGHLHHQTLSVPDAGWFWARPSSLRASLSRHPKCVCCRNAIGGKPRGKFPSAGRARVLFSSLTKQIVYSKSKERERGSNSIIGKKCV